MTGDSLRVEQRGPIRWLFLNRPERRNALNDEIITLLEEQADAADADPATSVVVIAGEGASFCAGGDFGHFLSEDDDGEIVSFLGRISACLSRIEASAKPWVAAIHGHAIAGGLEIALVCDAVIAAEATWIGDGHVNNRLIPGAGSSVRLERAVGKSTARWMHLSGELVSAEDLARTGWIRSVVPPLELRSRAQGLAGRLASKDSRAQQNLKRLLNSQVDLDTATSLQRELDAFGQNWVENDTASALRAFLAARGTPAAQEAIRS